MNEKQVVELESRLRPRLRRLAARLGVPEDERDDVVQEAFLALLGGADVQEPEAYLQGVVRNHALMHHRRAYRRQRVALEEILELLVEPAPQQRWHRHEDLRRSLHRLPRRYRVILRLRQRGLTAREIAALTGDSHKGVANVSLRGIERLRRMLTRDKGSPRRRRRKEKKR